MVGDQINPAIAMDASGDFVVVWQSEQPAGNPAGSGTSTLNDSVRPACALGNEIRVNNEATVNDQIEPS